MLPFTQGDKRLYEPVFLVNARSLFGRILVNSGFLWEWKRSARGEQGRRALASYPPSLPFEFSAMHIPNVYKNKLIKFRFTEEC